MPFDLNIYAIIILAVAIWTIPWKGVALWKAARNGQKAWFIIMLIVNTVAILEILYIFFFSKKKEGSQEPYRNL
jgi:hypothetical protein